MSQPCTLIVALPSLGPRFWSTLPRIIIHHLTPLLFLINPILCNLYNGMKTAGGCAFMPPVTEQSITLSFFLLSYPYFSTSFFHMFNMFFAIKSFNWCNFQCLGLQWLKRDIPKKVNYFEICTNSTPNPPFSIKLTILIILIQQNMFWKVKS